MKKYAVFYLFLFCFLCFFPVLSVVSAEQTNLSWYAPTTNEDGTPLLDLTGYKIHLGTVSHVYTQHIDVGNVITYTVTNLTPGTLYYFAVSAYNSQQKESEYSNEISRMIPFSQQYTLSVSKSGTGSGTIASNPDGISCGSDCIEIYTSGMTVTLSASSDVDSSFTGWSGACTGVGVCTLSMDGPKTVSGTFTKNASQPPDNVLNNQPGDNGQEWFGIEWPDPRFIDNDDGTVTDNLTGLIWLKDGSCFGKKKWEDALSSIIEFNTNPLLYHCAEYSQAYSDWRMPNIKELDSLINYGVAYTSHWLNENGFFGIQTAPYWTSTTYPGKESSLILDMGTGFQKISPMKKSRFILLVRGVTSADYYEVPQSGQTESHTPGDDGDKRAGKEWPDPRFIDNDDGTVTDNLTGLMWLKDGSCFGKKKWEDAVNTIIEFNLNPLFYHCAEYSQAYGDWHMPNIKEFESLINYGIVNQSDWLGMVGFINFQSASYWSSTSNFNDKNLYFFNDLSKRQRKYKSQNKKLYFVPVRSLP